MRFLIPTILVALFLAGGSGAFASTGNGAVPNPKLHHALNDAVQFYLSQKTLSSAARTAAVAAYAKDHRLIVQNMNVLVEIFLSDTGRAFLQRLAKFGIVRDKSYGRINRRLQAFVPLRQLDALAREVRVNWIQPPTRAVADVTSEGVSKTYADTYHNHVPSYDGTGVKVAIIDLGFQNYQAKLGTELPAAVTAVSFRSDNDITGGGQVHGTACAEVVHDMAPGAQLYLLNFNTVNDLNSAVSYCITHGVNVISHSIGWTNNSFYDGTGDLKTIVDNATTNGIVWCNSSGNQANRHWDGMFNDPDLNTWENFNGPDEDININLTKNSPCTLSLTWDQWPNATSDYDLFLYQDVGGNLVNVASSTNIQNGAQPPTEEISYTPTQTGLYHIKIKKKNGVATRLALFCFEYDFAEYNVTARSMLDPSPVVNAFAVGAVNVNSDVIESFSSIGPTEDGRLKPDISAPDGNANSVYGTFFGTSSACPHTAGAAALLLQENGARTVAQVKTILIQNALDLGSNGADNIYGAGRLRMPDITAPTTPVVTSSTHTVGVWSNIPVVSLTWPASIDTWSGVAGYSFQWDHVPASSPDSIVDGTLATFTTSLADGKDWYFHVRAVDHAGNASPAAHFGPLKIDATPPNIPVLLATNPLVNAWSNRDTIKATWSDTDFISGVKGYVAVIDHIPTTSVTSGLLAIPASLATAIAEGIWYVHVASSDSAGNWSPTLSIGPFRIDHTPPLLPSVSTVPTVARTWINQRHIAATWSSTDALSGVMWYHWVWDTLAIPSVFTDSGFVGTGSSMALTDSRLWMLHVNAVDSAGNISARADAGPFYIDSTPPLLPTTITTNPPRNVWASQNSMSVFFSGQRDAMSGVKGVALGWDSLPNGIPTQLMFAGGTYTISSVQDGRWFAHLRTLDSAGNWSAIYTAGPLLIDTHAPHAMITYSSIPAGNWTNVTKADTIRWRVQAADTAGLGNILGYSWRWSTNAFAKPDTIVVANVNSAVQFLTDGQWYFKVQAVDSANNWQGLTTPPAMFGPIQIDRTPPTAIMTVNNGAHFTTDSAVTVHVVGSDATSGLDSCVLQHDGIGSVPQFVGATADFRWILRDRNDVLLPGWHHISGHVRDSAGNWSQLFSDSVLYTPTAVNEGTVVANSFGFSVYPNPVGSGDRLRIHDAGLSSSSVHVALVDALGRTVVERTFAGGASTMEFSLPSLASGEYGCRMQNGSRLTVAALTVIR